MDDPADWTKVAWRDWGPAAFEAAQSQERPVLLAVTGFWSGWSRAMDGRTYSDPRIAAAIADATVPVRVDADAHPLVRARYTMGGLPATVFLTPEGRLLASAGYLDADEFREVLDRVVDSWSDRDDDIGRIPDPLEDPTLPGGRVTNDIVGHLVGQLDAQFDERHAGWGTDVKFPLPAAIEFALVRRPDQATRTLRAIRDSLEDPGDGGFFRHARETDWRDPMLEKLLSVNASLLRAIADAYLVTGESAYRDLAGRTVEHLLDTLWNGESFANSQAPGEYFSAPPEERDPGDAPPVDPARYADTNALAIDALLRYVAYTDDERTREHARRALNWLETECVSDGAVAHHPGESAGPIRLVDQAATLQALSTANQVLGPSFEATARSIADRTIEVLQDDPGAFRDGNADGPALLGRPLYPIEENARTADALLDLALISGDDTYREAATRALAAFADAAEHLGVQAARYGRAAARVLEQPLVIDVATPPGSDMHRAALRMANPEKVVVPGADIDGPDLAAIRGTQPASVPITEPADLAEAVERVQ